MTNELNEPREFPDELLVASVDQRLQYFEEQVFVEHLLLTKVLDEILEVIINPGDKLLILVCGATGVGKTTLVKALRKRLKERARNDPNWDVGRIAAVIMTLIAYNNAIFNWRDFYIRVLKEMAEILLPYKMVFEVRGISYGANGEVMVERTVTASDLHGVLEKALEHRRPQAFVFDEGHHLLKLAKGTQALDQLESLKSLIDSLHVPTVFLGIHNLMDFHGVSGQLDRRMKILQFDRYHGSIPEHTQQFRDVLRSFLRSMPLDETPKLEDHWADFFAMSFGEVGLLKDWLYDSFKHVLENQKPRLTWEICEEFCPQETLLGDILAGETKYDEYRKRNKDAEEKRKAREALREAMGLPSLAEFKSSSIVNINTNHKGTEAGNKQHDPKDLTHKPGKRAAKRDKVGMS